MGKKTVSNKYWISAYTCMLYKIQGIKHCIEQSINQGDFSIPQLRPVSNKKVINCNNQHVWECFSFCVTLTTAKPAKRQPAAQATPTAVVQPLVAPVAPNGNTLFSNIFTMTVFLGNPEEIFTEICLTPKMWLHSSVSYST